MTFAKSKPTTVKKNKPEAAPKTQFNLNVFIIIPLLNGNTYTNPCYNVRFDSSKVN